MHFKLSILFLVILISSCIQSNSVRWTPCSNTMGGFINIKVSLPNIINQKSSIQFFCQEDPEYLHVFYSCLIGTDTGLVNIKSVIRCSNEECNPGRESINKVEMKDTTYLTRMLNQELENNRYTKLKSKEIKLLNGHVIYIIKCSIKDKLKCLINYHNGLYSYNLETENIKDEKIIDAIINSMIFEKSDSFLCF